MASAASHVQAARASVQNLGAVAATVDKGNVRSLLKQHAAAVTALSWELLQVWV